MNPENLPQKTSTQKTEVTQQAKKEIDALGLRSLYLSSLIALLPAYLTDRIVRNRLSSNIGLIVVIVVFMAISMTIQVLLGRWIRKRPGSRWNWFVN